MMETKRPTRLSLRSMLMVVLRHDASLDAFCIDHFPGVYDEFTLGMTRTTKLNILLTKIPTDQILVCLRESHLESTRRHEYLIILGDGQDPLPTCSLDARELRIRKLILSRVRKFWIDGILRVSLHGASFIELKKQYCPKLVTQPWEKRWAILDEDQEPIISEKRMIDVFEDSQGELLIIGAPGAGKTTMLLDLCKDLINRATTQESAPIPVVLSLSSWAEQQSSLLQWLIVELRRRYDVPSEMSKTWLEENRFLLLLDGLDEIANEYRGECVNAINRFRGHYGLTEMVISTREDDYKTINAKLHLHNAIRLMEIEINQARNYLSSVNFNLEQVQSLYQNKMEFSDAIKSPLMLSILSVSLQDDCAKPESLSTERKHPITKSDLLRHYVQNALFHRQELKGPKVYNLMKVLRWSAKMLSSQNQTTFSTQDLRSNVLSNVKLVKLYNICSMVIGFICIWLLMWMFIFLLKASTDDNPKSMLEAALMVFGMIGFTKVGKNFLAEHIIFLSLTKVRFKGFLNRSIPFFDQGNTNARLARMVKCFIFIIACLTLLNIAIILHNLVNGNVWHQSLTKYLVALVAISIMMGLFVGLLLDEVCYQEGSRYNISSLLKLSCTVATLVGPVGIIMLGKSLPIAPNGSARIGVCAFLTITSVSIIGIWSGWTFGRILLLRCFLNLFEDLPIRLDSYFSIAVDRILLVRVGHGYMFIHKLFMEHFAEMRNVVSFQENSNVSNENIYDEHGGFIALQRLPSFLRWIIVIPITISLTLTIRFILEEINGWMFFSFKNSLLGPEIYMYLIKTTMQLLYSMAPVEFAAATAPYYRRIVAFAFAVLIAYSMYYTMTSRPMVASYDLTLRTIWLIATFLGIYLSLRNVWRRTALSVQ